MGYLLRRKEVGRACHGKRFCHTIRIRCLPVTSSPLKQLGLRQFTFCFSSSSKQDRVHFAGCTAQPDSAWITQQARQIVWALEDREPSLKYLIHDRDTKFSASFDTVFAAEGIDSILTPYQAPNANAFAERWIRSAREECLDQLLIFNEAHLWRVLEE